MAKVQIAFRLDEDLLEVIDAVAARTGETRTDVIVEALEQGLYREQKFIALQDTPVVREVVNTLEKAGVLDALASLLGREIDQRKVRIADHLRGERRKAGRKLVAKGEIKL